MQAGTGNNDYRQDDRPAALAWLAFAASVLFSMIAPAAFRAPLLTDATASASPSVALVAAPSSGQSGDDKNGSDARAASADWVAVIARRMTTSVPGASLPDDAVRAAASDLNRAADLSEPPTAANMPIAHTALAIVFNATDDRRQMAVASCIVALPRRSRIPRAPPLI